MVQWYIQRTDEHGRIWYYIGADQWDQDYYKRYIWRRNRPSNNHPVFKLYTGCSIIEQRKY